jgi:hypothetical protein
MGEREMHEVRRTAAWQERLRPVMIDRPAVIERLDRPESSR